MKILIIDDSSFMLSTVEKTLKINFPEAVIIRAENGQKGFDLYIESKPDIIVTDLLMPLMTGQELIAKIRETDKDTKIFVSSADIQAATKTEVLEMGICEFINKPLNSEKLKLLSDKISEVYNA